MDVDSNDADEVVPYAGCTVIIRDLLTKASCRAVADWMHPVAASRAG